MLTILILDPAPGRQVRGPACNLAGPPLREGDRDCRPRPAPWANAVRRPDFSTRALRVVSEPMSCGREGHCPVPHLSGVARQEQGGLVRFGLALPELC